MGPCNPVVKDRTLIFTKTNWMPTKTDDIYVFYRYPPTYLKEQMDKSRGKH